MTTGACAVPCGEGGGDGSGDDNDFTGGAGGTSQASRRGGARPQLELPRSRLQKASALTRAAILR